MTPLPKKTLEWMLKVKSSYNFLTSSRLTAIGKRPFDFWKMVFPEVMTFM